MKNFIKHMKCMLCGMLIMSCISACGKDTAQYITSEEVYSATEKKEIELQETVSEAESEKINSEPVLIYVYICGAVENSGVYTLSSGSRVCDLFELAGGLTEEAAADYWNQASLLTDGQMLYVPTNEEAKERQERGLDVSSEQSEHASTSGKINLNTASLEQLMEIPGIGESKARAILNYRETNGGFSSIEEVMNIEGIKEGVFSKMKEYIVVN